MDVIEDNECKYDLPPPSWKEVWRRRFWKGVHAMRRWDELVTIDWFMNLDYLEHLAATSKTAYVN